jgi:DNA-binding CsgD family transcriptional regulator
MSDLLLYSEHLARLIPAIGSARFPEQLAQMLMQLAPSDDVSILLYPGNDLPVIEYFQAPENGSASTLGVFIKGAFLLDPYYLAATREIKFGVFLLHELSPEHFKDSEYYKTWYRNCGYQDECGYLIKIGPEGFVNIAIGKTKADASFTDSDLTTLKAILPTVETLCQRHWEGTSFGQASTNLRKPLNAALDAFGSSHLTEREAQVVNLILHGHSTKSLAEKLSISVETVKLHRKHAYAKLAVRSQAELFYLFLDSVMSAKDYAGGDTLVNYLSKPDGSNIPG